MIRLVVLGGDGVVGRWAVAHLAADEDRIVTVDRDGAVDHRADVRAPTPAVRAAVSSADVIVLALPEDVAVECFGWLSATVPPTASVVSTCSVQTPLFERAASLGMSERFGGVVPMFSPTLPPTGRPVAVVTEVHSSSTNRLCELLAAAGMRVSLLQPAEYDSLASYLQVLPHAAVLGFIGALAQSPVDVARLMEIATPPVRTLIALACRILTAPPEVYWDIQRENPQGADRREELIGALARLDRTVAGGDPEDFRAGLASAATWLGPQMAAGAKDCEVVFRSLPALG